MGSTSAPIKTPSKAEFSYPFQPVDLFSARVKIGRLYTGMGMDAVFTDYPDLAVQVRAEFTESIE